jgi:chromosomal replication initiation ATPase DnaA
MNTTTMSDIWKGHGQFERERHRAAFEERTGSLDGYQPPKPEELCDGIFEWYSRSGPVWLAACTVCNQDIGVNAKHFDPAEAVSRRRSSAGFPSAFEGKPFDATPGTLEARTLLRSWVEGWGTADRPPPALTGPAGRGKTHLLVLAAATLIDRHQVDVMFTPAGELVESQRGDTSRMERAVSCGLLVLDDLSHAPTEWTAEGLYQLVDVRYRHGRPILLSTNAPVKAWPDTFGDRTASRLVGMTDPVAVTGPDFRQLGIQATVPDDMFVSA